MSAYKKNFPLYVVAITREQMLSVCFSFYACWLVLGPLLTVYACICRWYVHYVVVFLYVYMYMFRCVRISVYLCVYCTLLHVFHGMSSYLRT